MTNISAKFDTADVNYYLKSSPLSSQCKYRSALAWLLLTVIAYGALVEVVHSHGTVPSGNSNLEAFSDAGDAPSSAQNYADQKDCSTCQFQRQLFGGYVSSTPFTRSPVIECVPESSPNVFYISTLTTPRSGRAPPTV